MHSLLRLPSVGSALTCRERFSVEPETRLLQSQTEGGVMRWGGIQRTTLAMYFGWRYAAISAHRHSV